MNEDASWYVFTCPRCNFMYDSRLEHSCYVSTVAPVSTEIEKVLSDIFVGIREAVRLLKEIEYHTRTR